MVKKISIKHTTYRSFDVATYVVAGVGIHQTSVETEESNSKGTKQTPYAIKDCTVTSDHKDQAKLPPQIQWYGRLYNPLTVSGLIDVCTLGDE